MGWEMFSSLNDPVILWFRAEALQKALAGPGPPQDTSECPGEEAELPSQTSSQNLPLIPHFYTPLASLQNWHHQKSHQSLFLVH